jgi:HD-GYP domain-containing protein (c-di-GMP phosphodiesterase class II)
MTTAQSGILSSETALAVDLRQVVHALADALDLVGVDDVAHGKRVGIMAAACGRQLGLDVQAQAFLFDLGMLHDIGVSSTRTHRYLVSEFDWAAAQSHCVVGYERLSGFPPFIPFALPVRYHHTQWSVLESNGDLPEPVKLQANLIYLVDRVDALAAVHASTSGNLLMHVAEIREQIAVRGGAYFSPRLVEAFLQVSGSEAFWLQLEPRGIDLALRDRLAFGAPQLMSLSELRQLAELFSRIVDAKSPFTAAHSRGVAQLAKWLGECAGLSRVTCEKLEIAGLLHDLGKLRVPDEILEKPAPLDAIERKIMDAHSFETFQVLRHIQGLEEITRWAAYHHEEPDGSGYPFRLPASQQPLEARILRVADIFQAMAQTRPYRAGLDADGVRGFLEKMAAEGRVDREIVALAFEDMPGAMQAACGAA